MDKSHNRHGLPDEYVRLLNTVQFRHHDTTTELMAFQGRRAMSPQIWHTTRNGEGATVSRCEGEKVRRWACETMSQHSETRNAQHQASWIMDRVSIPHRLLLPITIGIAMTSNKDQASNTKDPASSIQHPGSSIQYQASSFQSDITNLNTT